MPDTEDAPTPRRRARPVVVAGPSPRSSRGVDGLDVVVDRHRALRGGSGHAASVAGPAGSEGRSQRRHRTVTGPGWGLQAGGYSVARSDRRIRVGARRGRLRVPAAVLVGSRVRAAGRGAGVAAPPRRRRARRSGALGVAALAAGEHAVGISAAQRRRAAPSQSSRRSGARRSPPTGPMAPTRCRRPAGEPRRPGRVPWRTTRRRTVRCRDRRRRGVVPELAVADPELDLLPAVPGASAPVRSRARPGLAEELGGVARSRAVRISARRRAARGAGSEGTR